MIMIVVIWMAVLTLFFQSNCCDEGWRGWPGLIFLLSLPKTIDCGTTTLGICISGYLGGSLLLSFSKHTGIGLGIDRIKGLLLLSFSDYTCICPAGPGRTKGLLLCIYKNIQGFALNNSYNLFLIISVAFYVVHYIISFLYDPDYTSLEYLW